MLASSDLWQSTSTNSNSLNQSFYFPPSFDFNSSTTNPNQQYHTTDNTNYDYHTLPDTTTSYLVDPYSHMFPTNYSFDPYTTTTTTTTQTAYNSTPMDYSSSTYLSSTDTYSHLHPIYTNTNVLTPPVSSSSYFSSSSSSLDIQPDYQSSSSTTTSQWDSTMIKMPSHESTYSNS